MLQQIIKLKLDHFTNKTTDLYKAYLHYTAICEKEGITITYGFNERKYHAHPINKRIHVPLPTTLEGISIIYHELGHLLHRMGSHIGDTGKNPSRAQMAIIVLLGDPNEIIHECNANFWAIRNSPIPLDYKRLKTALDTYTTHARPIVRRPKKLLKKLNDQMLVRCKL